MTVFKERYASMNTHQRLCLAMGATIVVLQTGRVLLWGRVPTLLQVPVDADAYIIGALFFWCARRAWSEETRRLSAVVWGVACGVDYRSFFEQIADPSRHAGHEVLVIAVKGALLVVAVLGAAHAVRAPADERREVGSA